MSYLKTKLIDRVKSILQEHPKARENNNFFMSIVWKQDMSRIQNLKSVQGYDAEVLSGYVSFLDYLGNYWQDLTNWDSATRAKRKVQENNIELRGETYQKRKDKEAQVAKELRQRLRKSEIMDYEADDFYFIDETEDC